LLQRCIATKSADGEPLYQIVRAPPVDMSRALVSMRCLAFHASGLFVVVAILLTVGRGSISEELLLKLGIAAMVVFPALAAAHVYLRKRKEAPPGPPQGRELLWRARIERRYPSKDFVEHNANGEDREELCAVCLEAKEPLEPCRKLQCGHSYHTVCIDRWWLTKEPGDVLACPMCRRGESLPADVSIPGIPQLAVAEVV